MGVIDDLKQARETFERGDWVSAYEAWSDVDADSLGADDLLRLGSTALLLGEHEACVEAFQTAFRTYVDGGELPKATRCAFWLSMTLATGGNSALAAGWTARADRAIRVRGVRREQAE